MNHSDSERAKLTVVKTSTQSLSATKALSMKLLVKTIVKTSLEQFFLSPKTSR